MTANTPPNTTTEGGWMPIDLHPTHPMGVLLYVPTERHERLTAGHDYAFQVGFWTGEDFAEQGTGHSYKEHLESWGGHGDYPSHWMPLPAAPVSA